MHDISGIWLSSDDSEVLPELQELVPRYFPSVTADRIVSVISQTSSTDSTPHVHNIPTTQGGMVGN